MPSDEIFSRARTAWARTGKPVRVVDDMTEAEVSNLAALTNVDGSAVHDFASKMADFLNDYYEARKAACEEADIPDTEVEED